jgi:hypothetical protein
VNIQSNCLLYFRIRKLRGEPAQFVLLYLLCRQQLKGCVAEGDGFDLTDRDNRNFSKAVVARTSAGTARDHFNAVTGYRAQKAGKTAALSAYGNDFINIFT